MSQSPPLRILLAGPTLGKFGGLEAFTLTMAESLAQTAGFEPRLCFKLVGHTQFDPQLRALCERTRVPFEVVPRGSRELWKNLRWADVVHSQNASPDIVLGARLLGRPVVVTMHNHQLAAPWWPRILWRLAVRSAQARCYVSDYVRRAWEPAGLRPGSQIMPAVSGLPERPLTWERRGFVFLSRWIAHKGLEPLLEAYAGARLDHEAWPLTLAGDGPLRPWVENFVAQHKLNTVRLAGFVSGEAKYTLLREAKWNVAPPQTREDLGLTPIEARQFAVPSIITRDGGLPEAAGPHALVAEPGDVAGLRARLEEAASMPEDEYRRRALASQAQLSEFLKPLSDYHELYHRLAGRR